MASAGKQTRCAIYTRKSTEHGLELEFNSLDAQRDACEAYIKSQASQGWICLPKNYNDAAYSGGNLERPALKALLADVEAGRVDVIVVYKIDRLTRSLADFAKLVETFDAKSVSFVAVTQQFNTTSSMGRLTLNVLLSFAQFERELSSERVRDKVAASRAKGKWTGGTAPLGYEAKDKKLVINHAEAATVRTIFELYLKNRGFQPLMAELDRRGVVTKRRQTKFKKYQGGIPFTYGPLAYLLKNRVYLGEIGYRDKWYPGEHQPILDAETFDRAQALLATNAVDRKATRTSSGALLIGKLFDDAGNIMSPSYSSKKAVRYRFYVSSALLRGRKAKSGTVGRVSAIPIEDVVTEYIRRLYDADLPDRESFRDYLDRVVARIVVHKDRLRVTLLAATGETKTEDLLWSGRPNSTLAKRVERPDQPQGEARPLLKAILRAQAWIKQLEDGSYPSVEALAKAVGLHPGAVRQSITLAFVPPRLLTDLLHGTEAQMPPVRKLQAGVSLDWRDDWQLTSR